MQKRIKNRIRIILILLTLCSIGIYLILKGLENNIVFFYPPSEIYKIQDKKQKVRVGGIVKTNSVQQLTIDKIIFTITDYKNELNIHYQGIIPALFRDGQGIVAEGKFLNNENFQAFQLLTKHDENYKPPEIKTINKN